MGQTFDAVVVGLGAMGSAATYCLAERGVRVLGLDRFTPPHSLGSSHGHTRMIREAYFEHPLYVPLVQRAYLCWERLEARFGQRLLVQTGGLMIGPPDGSLVQGARRSAELHHLAYEELSADEVRRRFPPFRPPEGLAGVLEPRAGVLFPETCIGALLEHASRLGAELHYGEPVSDWHCDGDGVRVVTEKGTYRSGRLLVTAGAWIGDLLRPLGLPLEVERQAQCWFDTVEEGQSFDPERCPVFVWEHEPERFWYGFPNFGDGVKIALHHGGEKGAADDLRRTVDADEVEDVRRLLRRFLPAANGRLRETSVCMYTNTPDGHFLVDVHPEHPQIVLASACSGHGFKFASLFGEILADLVIDRRTSFDLEPFRLARLM